MVEKWHRGAAFGLSAVLPLINAPAKPSSRAVMAAVCNVANREVKYAWQRLRPCMAEYQRSNNVGNSANT